MSCELALVVGRPYDLPGCAASANPLVSCCPPGSQFEGGMLLRFIGLDVHREFAQVAMLEGGQVRQVGRIPTTPAALRAFTETLGPDDQVALEATCNTFAIVRLLQQHAGRVVVSNPLRTRAIAEAKIKTDKVDAEVLVRLLASGWLPEVWVPDDLTQTLRQQVTHRARLVQQQTRLKNRVHSILHRNLVLVARGAICLAKRAAAGSSARPYRRCHRTSELPRRPRSASLSSSEGSSPRSSESWPARRSNTLRSVASSRSRASTP